MNREEIPNRHIGAVLVGGESSRFGAPKPLAMVGERTILERVLSTHRVVFPRTLLVTSSEKELPGFEAPGYGAVPPERAGRTAAPRSGFAGTSSAGSMAGATIVIRDIVPGAGPLGGLHAALVWARDRDAAGVCVTACDAPFVEAALLTALISASPGHDAVVPVTGSHGRLQPLFAWYSHRIIQKIEDALEDRRLALHQLIEGLGKAKLLPANELPIRRPIDLVFMNVNTPADLAAAREAVEEYPDES